jgi:hypothetical protein
MRIGRSLAGCLIAVVLAADAAAAACTIVDSSHARWTRILARSVEDGSVDYAELQRSGRSTLDAYLAELSGTCAADYERWTREERIAFWVNAYNAATVRLILAHYPIASIRKVGWLPLAAFREPVFALPGLKGGTVSLDDIEHGTLRRDFAEPRVHFALVCAARSCPSLRNEAYRGADLDGQLDDQARKFLRDPRKNRVDARARMLWLSSIFRWFPGDFEAAAGTLPAYVARYLGDEVATYDVAFLDYDWSLNDRAAPDTAAPPTGGRR